MEIQRRQEEPTDIEQVEDILFEMVERIHRQDELRTLRRKFNKKLRMRYRWNPCTRGYRMLKLGAIVTEEGVSIQLTSDLDFIDMIISPFGAMLPLTTPPGLFLKFAEEREAVRLQKLEEQRNREEERAMEYERIKQSVSSGSLADDARLILAIGYNGMQFYVPCHFGIFLFILHFYLLFC